MFEIRRGKLSDLDSIVELQVKMARETEGLKLERDVVTKGVSGVFEKPTRGTYWVAEEKDPLGQMENEYVPKLGREMAAWGIREELKHYTHIALIDTQVANLAPLRQRAIENARFLDKQYTEIPGTLDFFKKIIAGPYTRQDFLFLKAGQTVRQKPFLC